MALFRLCKGDDEILRALFRVYGANILRVPELRVQPLTVFARKGDQHVFSGRLGPLLDSRLPRMPPEISPMAEVSGRRTRAVKASAGLKILGGLLDGLGLPSAGIVAHFSSALTVSFTVANVNRLWIDSGLLGRNLVGRRVDSSNPSARRYFEERPWDLLVVESAITSDGFTVTVERSRSAQASLDIPAIHALVAKANAGVEVSGASALAVSFRGPNALSFAFTCVRLFVDPDGRIALLNPQDAFLNAAVAKGEILYLPDRVKLSTEPAMIEWDEG